MASLVYKPGQVALTGAHTEDVLHTCPTTHTEDVDVCLCNRDAAGDTVRLWVAVGGEATDVKQYLWYDKPILANDALKFEHIVLNSTDVIRASSNGTKISATCFVRKSGKVASYDL